MLEGDHYCWIGHRSAVPTSRSTAVRTPRSAGHGTEAVTRHAKPLLLKDKHDLHGARGSEAVPQYDTVKLNEPAPRVPAWIASAGAAICESGLLGPSEFRFIAGLRWRGTAKRLRGERCTHTTCHCRGPRLCAKVAGNMAEAASGRRGHQSTLGPTREGIGCVGNLYGYPLELTRFGGHLPFWGEGDRHAEDQAAVHS